MTGSGMKAGHVGALSCAGCCWPGDKLTGDKLTNVQAADPSEAGMDDSVDDLVRVVGHEPTRGCPRQILSLLRLPFRHTRQGGPFYAATWQGSTLIRHRVQTDSPR